jgi:membrane-bound lytic murein transglycosylase D
MTRTAALALSGGILFLACVGAAYPGVASISRNDPFPTPPELSDAVHFWRQVFGVWRRSQVALHDDTHLSLVYEVTEIPSAAGDGWSSEQKDYVRQRKRLLEQQLAELEAAVKAGAALRPSQMRLLGVITGAAGKAALYGASQRVRSQRGMRERFLRGLEISGRYDALMRGVFRQAGLPEDLAYLPHVESSFVSHARSSAGAVGIWQFMPSAGRRFLRINNAVDERYDPVLAARGAARYLARAYEELGTWPLAITSYNHGIGGMVRAEERFGPDLGRIVRDYDGPAFGFSSRNFYAEFLAVRSLIAEADTHFPGVHPDPPLEEQRLRLTRSLPAHRLAALCGVTRAELADRNPAWTAKAASGRVPLPAGTEVWIPKNRAGPSADLLAYAQPMGHVAGIASRPPGPGPQTAEDVAVADDEAVSPAVEERSAGEADGFVRVSLRHHAARKHSLAKRSAKGVRAKAATRRKRSPHGLHKHQPVRRMAARPAVRASSSVARDDNAERRRRRLDDRVVASSTD